MAKLIEISAEPCVLQEGYEQSEILADDWAWHAPLPCPAGWQGQR